MGGVDDKDGKGKREKKLKKSPTNEYVMPVMK